MKIIKDNENNLTSRHEMFIELEQGSTPSNTQVQELIADKTKTDKELIIVKNIKTEFGKRSFNILAFVYKDKESKERFERVKVKKQTQAPAS